MVRAYRTGDYETLTEWWSGHCVEAPTEEMLECGMSWVVEWDGEPMAFCTVYAAESIGFIEWLTMRPGQEVAVTRRAMGELVEHIQGCCDVLIGYTEHATLAKEAEKAGFMRGPRYHQLIL